jgi:hypothetical protein
VNKKSMALVGFFGMAILLLTMSSCVSLQLVSQRQAGVDATAGASEATPDAPAASAN